MALPLPVGKPPSGLQNEARHLASNIAKLPSLLGKVRPDDNIQAVGNLSDERHGAEDTTPNDKP
jgi:hypothetical protein